MSREAREAYLAFARSPEARWAGNFRDFGASIRRMATLCDGGRISVKEVDEELERLRAQWRAAEPARDAGEAADAGLLERLLPPERFAALDRFERVQLEDVVRACRTARSLSEAGRVLFAASRAARTSTNDADRLRKYLARYDLSLQAIQAI
jgi:transcriptional regulatory protein RtcR